MINSVNEFIEEFMKHKDKVEWYLHKPTPFADATDIRGRDVLCSPVTVMVEPPIHHSLDYLDFDIDITPSFQDVVSRASSHTPSQVLSATSNVHRSGSLGAWNQPHASASRGSAFASRSAARR